MKKIIILFALLSTATLSAQHLKPGFDKSECIELLKMGAKFGDSAYTSRIPDPIGFKMVYRSSIVGLDNCWDNRFLKICC